MQPELNPKLKDIDKAYLAGLLDGEGCANATFRSKKYFAKRIQKEKHYFWPAVQFVISGEHQHLQFIKEMIGIRGLYKGTKGNVWDQKGFRQSVIIKRAIFILTLSLSAA